MKLVDELFIKYTLVEDMLSPYGFRKDGDSYFYNHLIHNNEFELQVTIKNQKIDAKLIEKEFNDEYFQINTESPGGFINALKEECSKVLLDIRDKCFKEEYFIFPQTNRIAELIKNKYGVLPEIMAFGKARNGVFRNPSTRKWIGLVMCNKRSNITGDSDEKVEYLNLNFKEDAPLYNQKGIYHPYKKQNKHWIVIIMDETLSDEEIMDLVAIGYENSCK
ncbi:MAG: hypothetical protein IJQ23_02485 [Clostridia bacterium]|nr:hypothetical protein [Clostridia bacterium]